MLNEDPKIRLFDPTKEEKFLELKKIINVNYEYKIISDLQTALDKDLLKE